MKPIYLMTWSEVYSRACRPGLEGKSFYGIPRGGSIAAMAFAHANGGKVAGCPTDADFLVDDIIDSGRTLGQWNAAYREMQFLALVDKRVLRDSVLGWVHFPWELPSQADVSENIVRLLQFIGEDPNREGLKETPARVIRAWQEMTAGYAMDPGSILNKSFTVGSHDQMITLRKFPFVSMCEHHLLPFIGTATIAYIPQEHVVGLSKLGRLVDCYARRLQIQEVLTDQIAAALEKHAQPRGCGVRLVAAHQCMSCRGVNKGGEMITTALRGCFREPAVKAEFLGY